MILYLMRHANAGTIRENPVLDAKRSLVKEGKEQCMLMARVLVALKAPIERSFQALLSVRCKPRSLSALSWDLMGKLRSARVWD